MRDGLLLGGAEPGQEPGHPGLEEGDVQEEGDEGAGVKPVGARDHAHVAADHLPHLRRGGLHEEGEASVVPVQQRPLPPHRPQAGSLEQGARVERRHPEVRKHVRHLRHCILLVVDQKEHEGLPTLLRVLRQGPRVRCARR